MLTGKIGDFKVYKVSSVLTTFFKPKDETRLILRKPTIFNSDYFRKIINEKLEDLTLYIQKLGDEKSIQQKKDYIDYKINDVELWILYAIQYNLQSDQEELTSKEGLLFFIPKALFLKKCKEVLGIKRNEKEFVHHLIDGILSRGLPILKELDSKNSDHIQKGMGLRKKSFSRFFEASTQLVDNFLTIFNSKIEISKLVISQGSNLKKLSDYLKVNYLSSKAFPSTWKSLLGSIDYRKRMADYLNKIIEKNYKAKLVESRVSAKNTLSKLKKVNFDIDLKTELAREKISDEERVILESLLIEEAIQKSLSTASDSTSSNSSSTSSSSVSDTLTLLEKRSFF